MDLANKIMQNGKQIKLNASEIVYEESTGNVLDIAKFFKGQEVPGGDFNNIRSTGVYTYGGQTMPNSPPNWGIILVFRSTSNYVVQIWLGTGGSRFRFSSGSSWTAWSAFS